MASTPVRKRGIIHAVHNVICAQGLLLVWRSLNFCQISSEDKPGLTLQWLICPKKRRKSTASNLVQPPYIEPTHNHVRAPVRIETWGMSSSKGCTRVSLIPKVSHEHGEGPPCSWALWACAGSPGPCSHVRRHSRENITLVRRPLKLNGREVINHANSRFGTTEGRGRALEVTEAL